jgi:hypothetical protein
MIQGQMFVGAAVAPGVVLGRLGGTPYDIVGGVAPEPPRPIPFTPPPPIVLGAPDPIPGGPPLYPPPAR